MLNNETWLLHSDLFKKHWVVETKSWVRDLGWVSDIQKSVETNEGWLLFGDYDLTPLDYVNIVDDVDSEKKLYEYKEGKWEYIESPIVFVVKKNSEESFIAGWAGDKKQLDQFKKKDINPWNWKQKRIIEINPTIGLHPIKKTIREKSQLLPVFFTSNGETNAEENWKRLSDVCPRAVRVDGINGRRNVFLKCAELAESATHFFVVTGKNFITDKTVFDYQPDNTTPRAHIMFQSKNMSNRLEYGHMSVGCYNKDVILDTPENFGLDFTEFGKIYQIPRTVSEAYFATSPLEAWRTSFRECVKLSLRDSDLSKQWLNRWVAFSEGPNSEWVLLGAKQGREYAQANKDDEEALRKTVDWQWLEQYFRENSQVVPI